MGLVGFNPDEVTRLLTTYNNSYDNIVGELAALQSNFLEKMSDKWACNVAIEFFKGFKANIENAIVDKRLKPVFENLNDSINSAALEWANLTKTEYSKVSVTTPVCTLTVEGVIHENINGGRGAEPGIINIAKTALTKASDEIKTQFDKCIKATDASGFLGGTQQSALINTFTELRNMITNKLKEALDYADEAVKITEDNYGTLEGNVSKAFSGNQA